MHTLERYYSILELEPGGSLEEIHQAYRDLVFVWHPDRYTHNPRLQEKAQAKLQAVNEAHEHLCCHRSAPRPSSSPPQSSWPQSSWPQSPPPQSPWPQSHNSKTSRKKKSAQAQAPRAEHTSPHQSKQAPQQDPQQEPRKEARAKRPQADFSNFGHHQTSPPRDSRDSRDYDRDHTRDFREPQRGAREHIQMPCNNYNNCVWLD